MFTFSRFHFLGKSLCAMMCFMMVALYAEVHVTNVEVKPRWPWNGLVDIIYSVESDDADADIWVTFSGYDQDLARTVDLKAVSGEGVDTAVKVGGPYIVTWDSKSDESDFHSSNFIVTIKAKEGFVPTAQYLVVDLSGGKNAVSYPVRESTKAPNFTDDTCRTTELWLRRIPAGSFMMGSPEDELRHHSDEILHLVTLTQDFYIGVFECTQKQYELVTGNRGSHFSNATYYASRPVEDISYNSLRGDSITGGAGWPVYGHTVDENSFFGKLQAKTGLLFDLPTEAQWEYACRAGTTTALNSGLNLTKSWECPNMGEVGRYGYNGGSGSSYTDSTEHGTAKVGSYLPNAWGLYDMHGNVSEWCLDWYEANLGTNAVINPIGISSGSNRVCRGGSWGCGAVDCRSANRACDKPASHYYDVGFRIVCFPGIP